MAKWWAVGSKAKLSMLSPGLKISWWIYSVNSDCVVSETSGFWAHTYLLTDFRLRWYSKNCPRPVPKQIHSIPVCVASWLINLMVVICPHRWSLSIMVWTGWYVFRSHILTFPSSPDDIYFSVNHTTLSEWTSARQEGRARIEGKGIYRASVSFETCNQSILHGILCARQEEGFDCREHCLCFKLWYCVFVLGV